jgi:hypothetical protein
MKKITFDSGLRKYELGNGVLSFNPLDPNLYERFVEATEKLQRLEEEMLKSAKDAEITGVDALVILKDVDNKAKTILNNVFGGANDFDHMLAGVNLMAVATNGERVITNLMNALTPILEQGAKDCATSFMSEGKK